MNEKTLKTLAIKSIVAMLGVVLFSSMFTKYNGEIVSAIKNIKDVINNENEENVVVALDVENHPPAKFYENIETKEIVNSIGNTYLKIKKPVEKSFPVELEDLYMERKIRVSISNLEDKLMKKNSVVFAGTEGAPLLDVSVCYEYNPETFLYKAIFDIELDNIYVYCMYEDKENIYIDLLKPDEVYEQIVVIDVGHGGNDIGAYTKDMKVYEKDINLEIVLCLKELLDKREDMKVYYTRLTDEKVYLNPRLNLANDLKADMFISIHCNSSEYKSAKGSEALYSTKYQKKLSIKSDELAQILLNQLTETTNIKNRGLINGNDIYIIGNAKVPVALIEIGFISSPDELKFLKKKKNQELIAEGIYNGILKVYEKLEEQKNKE